MLDVVDGEGGEDHEEVVEVGLLLRVELAGEHLDQDTEVLVAAAEAGGEVAERAVEAVRHADHLLGQGLRGGEAGEHGNVLNVGHEPDGGGGVLEAA